MWPQEGDHERATNQLLADLAQKVRDAEPDLFGPTSSSNPAGDMPLCTNIDVENLTQYQHSPEVIEFILLLVLYIVRSVGCCLFFFAVFGKVLMQILSRQLRCAGSAS
jgi:hypothetical protein